MSQKEQWSASRGAANGPAHSLHSVWGRCLAQRWRLQRQADGRGRHPRPAAASKLLGIPSRAALLTSWQLGARGKTGGPRHSSSRLQGCAAAETLEDYSSRTRDHSHACLATWPICSYAHMAGQKLPAATSAAKTGRHRRHRHCHCGIDVPSSKHVRLLSLLLWASLHNGRATLLRWQHRCDRTARLSPLPARTWRGRSKFMRKLTACRYL